MKISIICVTNRKGALAFYNSQLSKQTFKDFEVIIADDLCQEEIDTSNLKYFKPRGKNDSDVWNLNKAYNDCLDKAAGELLVFFQDFIWISANGLQRFWDLYQIYPTALITGCGHKYEEDSKKIEEVDDRCLGSSDFEECHWSQWELNWASCPRSIMPRFKEEMDKNYGGENQYIAREASKKGYKVYLDRVNKCKGLSTYLCGGRPKNWEDKHWNKTLDFKTFICS